MNPFRNRIEQYRKIKYDKSAHIQQQYLDNAGKAVVRVHLTRISSAFSDYSVPHFEELDMALADYIDAVVYHIPLKYPLTILFYVPQSTTKEQKLLLGKTVKDLYGLRLADKNLDLTINLSKMAGLFAIGTWLLIFSYLLASSNSNQFFTDFMNIAGTFALWEMVDLFLLERRAIKVDKLNAAQIAAAEIRFCTDPGADDAIV